MVLKKYENDVFCLTVEKSSDKYFVHDFHKFQNSLKRYEYNSFQEAMIQAFDVLGEWTTASFQAAYEDNVPL